MRLAGDPGAVDGRFIFYYKSERSFSYSEMWAQGRAASSGERSMENAITAFGTIVPEHWAGGGIGAASIAYLLLALWRVAKYRSPAAAMTGVLPPVTVLNPVCV